MSCIGSEFIKFQFNFSSYFHIGKTTYIIPLAIVLKMYCCMFVKVLNHIGDIVDEISNYVAKFLGF